MWLTHCPIITILLNYLLQSFLGQYMLILLFIDCFFIVRCLRLHSFASIFSKFSQRACPRVAIQVPLHSLQKVCNQVYEPTNSGGWLWAWRIWWLLQNYWSPEWPDVQTRTSTIALWFGYCKEKRTNDEQKLFELCFMLSYAHA